MRKLMFVMISSALTLMACSEQDSINPDKLKASIRAQQEAAEKVKSQEVPFETKHMKITSDGGDLEDLINANGDSLIVGDKGIWMNLALQAKVDVASPGSDIAAALNQNGDWIAVGNKGVYVKHKTKTGQPYKMLRIGNSPYDANINENGDWIVAGNSGVYINATQLKGIVIPSSISGLKVHISNRDAGEPVEWSITMNNQVISGVFIKTSENLVDGSSPQ